MNHSRQESSKNATAFSTVQKDRVELSVRTVQKERANRLQAAGNL
jgi:hypothetical protein